MRARLSIAIKIGKAEGMQLEVLSKFRPEVDEESRARAFELARGLLRQIPHVKEAVVGPPISDGLTRGYDYGELSLSHHDAGF